MYNLLHTPWSIEMHFLGNFESTSQALASTAINYNWPENL